MESLEDFRTPKSPPKVIQTVEDLLQRPLVITFDYVHWDFVVTDGCDYIVAAANLFVGEERPVALPSENCLVAEGGWHRQPVRWNLVTPACRNESLSPKIEENPKLRINCLIGGSERAD